MFCNQCGSNIKDTANFCKYCGSKIKKSASTSTTSPTDTKTSSETYKPPVEPPRFITKEESLFSQAVMSEEDLANQLQEQGKNQSQTLTENDPFLNKVSEKFDPMTDETIDTLYSRERDVDIKEEIKESLAEVEKIEQRLNIGLLSKEEASDQIKEKQDLMSALKAERKSLKSDKIAIETLQVEIKEFQDKLEKLHIMYNTGKIAHESVYEKLKAEYNAGLKSKQEKYDQEKINVRNWLSVLQADVKKMKEDIDMTNTKADLGEVPKEDAMKKQSELEIDIYRKELAYHALKKVQENLPTDG